MISPRIWIDKRKRPERNAASCREARDDARQQSHEIARSPLLPGMPQPVFLYAATGLVRRLRSLARLTEVPVPDDVPSDGRGVCGACYELAVSP